MPKKCARHPSSRSERKTDSVISSDSDIRFTRRKLGDTQKCGCAVIAGVLIFMLFAAVATYIGCKPNSFIRSARKEKERERNAHLIFFTRIFFVYLVLLYIVIEPRAKSQNFQF